MNWRNLELCTDWPSSPDDDQGRNQHPAWVCIQWHSCLERCFEACWLASTPKTKWLLHFYHIVMNWSHFHSSQDVHVPLTMHVQVHVHVHAHSHVRTCTCTSVDVHKQNSYISALTPLSNTKWISMLERWIFASQSDISLEFRVKSFSFT